jgi:hypothetical protein
MSDDERITEPLSPHSHTAGSRLQGESLADRSYAEALPDAVMEDNRPTRKIELGRLSRNDQIVIETGYSYYSFTVIDPTVPRGKLTGGVLGNRMVDADLLHRFSRQRLQAHNLEGHQPASQKATQEPESSRRHTNN